MTQIGLISDTHNYLDDAVFKHFDKCDEIWHAGDFGSGEIADKLKNFKPLKGVYGNIDGYDIRSMFPEKLVWLCEDVKIFLVHIGGHPARYVKGIKNEIIKEKAKIFICGHSHILKVIFDQQINCLHINPGAAGKQGWHKIRTIIRFKIDGSDIKDCEVIELGKR